MRLIDADALLERVWDADTRVGYVQVVDRKDIEDAPTIEERKPGKWEIYVISPFDGEGCRCSNCGFEGAPYWDFCPECGSYNGGGDE